MTNRVRCVVSESDNQRQPSALDETDAHWAACLRKISEERDMDAFQKLFQHFGPLIKSFAHKAPSLLERETFAEDLVQETMLRVWNRASTFEATLSSPGTWIFTLARNMRIDLLRKQARHTVNVTSIHGNTDDDEPDMEDIWPEDESGDVFNIIVLQRNRKLVHDTLASLPAEQANILRKVYLEDKSHSEVATELELPLGTVKSRVRLALKKMQILIDR